MSKPDQSNEEPAQNLQHCPATRKDGQPCRAPAGADGWCIGHRPGAADARSRGGRGKSRAARAGKLLPSRLRPVAEMLESALVEVKDGRLKPSQAQAMASLAGALVRVVTSGEMEERLRDLESKYE